FRNPSGFSYGVPQNHSSPEGPSSVPYSEIRSDRPAPATAALKRVVCVTAQAAMYPPYDHPPIPRRSGLAIPLAIRSSTPAITSLKSPPPQSARFISVNFWPYPAEPRTLG